MGSHHGRCGIVNAVAEGLIIRTYAKAIPACGSMVLFFFCRFFFALQGEKEPTKGKNPWFG
jgi:hypothetical protein